MSKFFTGGSSTESETESDSSVTSSSESSGSESDSREQQQSKRTQRYTFDSDSDSSAGKKRVVRSAKDKAFDELRNTFRLIENAKKINDCVTIGNEFDKVTRQAAKAATLIQREGLPKFYLKGLSNLEDFVNELHADKDIKKKMNPSNARALTATRQKIRKFNKPIENEINAWKSNPIESEAEASSSASESESSVEKKPAKKGADFWKKKADASSSSESDSSEENSDSDADSSSESETSSSSSDEEAKKKKKTKPAAAVPRKNAFLKKSFGGDASSASSSSSESSSDSESESDSGDSDAGGDGKKGRRAVKKKNRREKKVPRYEQEDFTSSVGFTQVGKGGKALEITAETVYARLKDVADSRGKKGTDRSEQLAVLESVFAVAQTPVQKAKVLLATISARLDFSVGGGNFLAVEHWRKATKETVDLIELLGKHNDIIVTDDMATEDFDENSVLVPAIISAAESGDGDNRNDDDSRKVMRASLVSFVERLDTEYIKSLQQIDPHTTEYIERMRDEFILYSLICQTESLIKKRTPENHQHISRLVMLRIEHLYFKSDAIIAKGSEKADSHFKLQNLCSYIYIHGSDRLRARAILCHAYNLALNSKFYEARDLLLMSHLQDSIERSDMTTQVLFNRATVQIGISAFRTGHIREAHSCLHDIMGSSRVKELLAQGSQPRYGDRNPEQERLDKQRMLPFYMHINLELLECIYLTASLLLEIPTMAANAHEIRPRMISKVFRRMLEFSEKQIFNGPPENTRDHIMIAAKSLSRGEWKKAVEYVRAIKIWDLMHDAEPLKEMLSRKLQEEGLRTYFFTFSKHYDSLSLQSLATNFELSKTSVYSMVSKMIINEEIHASLERTTETVIFYRVAPSRLQYLASQLADKTATMVDNNEKLLDSRLARDSVSGYNGKENTNTGNKSGQKGRGFIGKRGNMTNKKVYH